MNSVSNFMSEEQVKEDDAPVCGVEKKCCKGEFLKKLFKYKFELVNLQSDQIDHLASAFDLSFFESEDHMSKVNKLCKVMGL